MTNIQQIEIDEYAKLLDQQNDMKQALIEHSQDLSNINYDISNTSNLLEYLKSKI